MKTTSNIIRRATCALMLSILTATAWATETTVTYTLDFNDNTKYWLKGTDGSSYNIGSGNSSKIGKTLIATLGNNTITITSGENIGIYSVEDAPSGVDWTMEFGENAYDFTVTTTSGYVKNITVYGIASQKISGGYENVVISQASEAYSNTLHWDYVAYSMSLSVGTICRQAPGKIVVTYTDVAPTFNISYVLNGGTNAAGNPSTYDKGTGVASLAAPTRTGYTFGGWYA